MKAAAPGQPGAAAQSIDKVLEERGSNQKWRHVRHFWHFSRGARRPPPVAETGRSKPSEQQEPQARFACDVDRRLRTVDANACEKVKARRAEVPSTRSAQARNTAQAKRRAVRNGKMHSRPGRCPSKARRAEVASTRSEAQCAATERRASVSAGRCVDKRPGNPR